MINNKVKCEMNTYINIKCTQCSKIFETLMNNRGRTSRLCSKECKRLHNNMLARRRNELK